MKDHPEATILHPATPENPKTARESSAIPRYGEMDRYILHFVIFTMIVHQVIAPIGFPMDAIRYIIFSMGHIAGMGLVYVIAVALVTKTVRSVSRRLRQQLPFRSREQRPRV